MKRTLWLLSLTLILFTACNGNNNADNQKDSYETTKQMVTDIIKTDEGKQAIIEVLSDEEAQQVYVIESEIVTQSINEALTSDEGKQFWTNMFSDPDFVKSFSEAMINQQEDVMKRLMNDPTYQEKMLGLLDNPEMNDQILTVLKSQQYRKHIEETIQEAFESPLLQGKLSEIIVAKGNEILGQQSDSGDQEESESGSSDSESESESNEQSGENQ